MVDTIYSIVSRPWAPWVVGLMVCILIVVLVGTMLIDDYCRRNASKWKREWLDE